MRGWSGRYLPDEAQECSSGAQARTVVPVPGKVRETLLRYVAMHWRASRDTFAKAARDEGGFVRSDDTSAVIFAMDSLYEKEEKEKQSEVRSCLEHHGRRQYRSLDLNTQFPAILQEVGVTEFASRER